MKFIRLAAAAALLAMSAAQPAVAGDELQRKVYLRGSQDFAHCSAFYNVYASVLDSTGNEAAATKARSDAKTTMFYAVDLAGEVEDADRARELATGYVRQTLDRMLELGKTDGDRFAALLKQYMADCKLAVDDPVQFTRARFADRPDPESFDAHSDTR